MRRSKVGKLSLYTISRIILYIDNVLATLHVLADYIEHHFSARLGKRLTLILSVPHSALWALQQSSGLSVCSTPPSAALRSLNISRILHPFAPLEANAILDRAHEISKQVIHLLSKNGSLKQGLDFNRGLVPSGSFSTGLLMHSLNDVRILLEAYRIHHNPDFLAAACAIGDEWISQCFQKEDFHDVWSDHATALRTLVLLDLLFSSIAISEDDKLHTKLLDAIIKHANRLANRWLYRSDHNHGVVQAYALLVAGLCLSFLPPCTKWRDLAKTRLIEQIIHNTSSEGLHHEQSPHYHFFVLRHFVYSWRASNAFGFTLGALFLAHLSEMLSAAAFLLKNNFTLPCLGDTPADSDEWLREAEIAALNCDGVEHYRFAVTNGKIGLPPQSTDFISPDAGTAIFRSKWSNSTPPFEPNYLLVFRLGTQQTAHVHRDIASFEWTLNGKDLIVDSGGPYDYGNSSPRSYFLSSWAHNTVVVDLMNQHIGRATIKRCCSAPNYIILDVEHSSYAGVMHQRKLIYLFPDILVVLDRLQSANPHQYSQLFHILPDYIVKPDGLNWIAHNSSNNMSISGFALFGESLTLQLWKGNHDPMRGWRCTSYGSMVPMTTVDFRMEGSNATIGTILIAREGQQIKPETATLCGDPFQSSAFVQLCVDGKEYTVALE